MHVIQNSVKLISIDVSTDWHRKESWGSVVSEVEENLGVLIALKDWSAAAGVSLKDSIKIFDGGVMALVVDLAAFVDVGTWGSRGGGFVENFSSEWVLLSISNIIVSEMDDLIWVVAIFDKSLISMAGISLMSVVHISMRTGNQHGPMVGSTSFILSSNGGKGTKSKFRKH